MKLEDQLATLAALGLALEPGVTIDDLLYSFDRESYEKRPFLERDGRKFRSRDNGQAMVLYYLDDATAQKLSELSGKPLTTVTG
jgi:hypothetical protein